MSLQIFNVLNADAQANETGNYPCFHANIFGHEHVAGIEGHSMSDSTPPRLVAS